MAGRRFMAHGTVVTVNSVTVSGLVSITLPDQSRGEAEITDGDSGFDREFVAGLRDNGTLSLEMRYIPGDAGQDVLRNLFDEDFPEASVVITLPPHATDDSSVATISFDGYVSALGGDLPLADDEAASFTAEIRVSGAITVAVA